LLVESGQQAASVIARNIETLGLSGAVVRRGTAESVLGGGAAVPVDLVFADPPYEVRTADLEALVRSLDRNGWTTTGTVMVVERPAGSAALVWPVGWEAWKARSYGDTRVEMAERGEGRQGEPGHTDDATPC
ncbi:MAG: rRNA ((966)-N(2))-methyltransferase RsmD, partial [Mycobacterium sp.]|jgi:16S rRNA G966 N2-methylase RsmD|nr:rRNA ((966)-N(2))-methyltransferase RsmD [Mycobacterium sp.]